MRSYHSFGGAGKGGCSPRDRESLTYVRTKGLWVIARKTTKLTLISSVLSSTARTRESHAIVPGGQKENRRMQGDALLN